MTTKEEAVVEHLDNVSQPHRAPGAPRHEKALIHDAQQSAELSHKLTVRDAVRAYPMAIFWSLAISMCVIMEGYDQILVPSLYAYPTFQKRYGQISGYDKNGVAEYQLTAAWQAGLGNAAVVGAFAGTLMNG